MMFLSRGTPLNNTKLKINIQPVSSARFLPRVRVRNAKMISRDTLQRHVPVCGRTYIDQFL